MKFMLLYKVHSEKRHDALKGFSQMTLDDDKADKTVFINIKINLELIKWMD